MEVLNIEEKDTASLIKTEGFGSYTEGTSIFAEQMRPKELWSFQDLNILNSLKHFQGTTIAVPGGAIETEKPEDDYEVGYYNDDYDIVAKAPITKSFKVKVKIRSISRLQPKVFLDDDEINQMF